MFGRIVTDGFLQTTIGPDDKPMMAQGHSEGKGIVVYRLWDKGLVVLENELTGRCLIFQDNEWAAFQSGMINNEFNA